MAARDFTVLLLSVYVADTNGFLSGMSYHARLNSHDVSAASRSANATARPVTGLPLET